MKKVSLAVAVVLLTLVVLVLMWPNVIACNPGNPPPELLRRDLVELADALESYRLATGRYPAELVELTQPYTTGSGVEGEPVLRRVSAEDYWGSPYVYEPDAQPRPRLCTLGADRAMGGDGRNADLCAP